MYSDSSGEVSIPTVNPYGFVIGSVVVFGGDPKPYGLLARIWWHLRRDLGGPRLLVKPREDGTIGKITSIRGINIIVEAAK